MKHLIATVLLLCATGVDAYWARTYGDASGSESATVAQETVDGAYVLAGSTDSFGAGLFDAWAVKVDSSGNIQWQRSFGGAGTDWLWSMDQTADGGCILAGYTDSFGEGFNDFWLLKLDQNGLVQWQKTYGGAGYDTALSIRQTSDGGFAVLGSTSSFGAGMEDIWLLKLTSSGAVQWQKTFGGSNNESGTFLDLTADGGYIVLSSTLSFGSGFFDLWLLKLDGSGNVQWQKAYGAGYGDDNGSAVHQTSDGGYIVAGTTSSFGAGGFDLLVLKLDALGTMEWLRTAGGVGNERSSSVLETSDNSFVIAGSTESFGAGGRDVWLLKFSSAGSLIWQKAYGTAGHEQPFGMEAFAGGGMIVAGEAAGDAWLLTLDSNGEIDASCPLAADTTVTAVPTALVSSGTAAGTSATLAVIQNTTVSGINTLASTEQQCGVSCAFCDDFEDGILAADWTYLKPAWTESGGALVANPIRKAIAIAIPAFDGCASCSFESSMMTAGGLGNRVWMLAWYLDKNNTIEVLMKEENDKFVLKQRIGGTIVAKTKGLIPLSPNISYNVRVEFDGGLFNLLVDGATIATMPAVGIPTGTVGFQAKNTIARFGNVEVD